MFEKILEKILIKYLGWFILGLDKNNLKLGIWNGNMAIENVNLNPEIIEQLDLPFKLLKSQIGKMSVKIPWKKLSSQPIEVTIENIYVTLNPIEREQWQFGDEALVQKKFEKLADYCTKCLKKGLKKPKEDKEKDQGYLDKMAAKIMDNIELKMINIHLRYEGPYSWGLTLESLEIFTTDENWKRGFIDRTENKNFVPMNKLFELQNLALYWDTKTQISQQDYAQFMDARILKKDEQARQISKFVISINAQVQMIQNNPSQMNLPLQDMQIVLHHVTLDVQKEQFRQMVELFSICTNYTDLLWVERKNAQDMGREKLMEHQFAFAVQFLKVMQSESKKKTLSILDEKEQIALKAAVRAVDYTVLLDWVTIAARQIIKENKFTKATSSKKKKESAWWKGSDKKNPDEVFLNEEEIMKIEEQINQIFEQERKKTIIRNDNSINQRCIVTLQGGMIKITNQQAGMQLAVGQMEVAMEKQENESFEVVYRLTDVQLDVIESEVVKRICYQQNKTDDELLKVNFKRDIQSANAQLIVLMNPFEFNYDPIFIKYYEDFFEAEVLIFQNINKANQQPDQEWMQKIKQELGKQLLQLSVKVSAINILLHEDHQLLYSLSMKDILYNTNKKSDSVILSLIVGSCSLQDQNSNIIVQDPKCKEAFLDYQFTITRDLLKTDIDICSLIVNWKPQCYLKVRQLLKIKDDDVRTLVSLLKNIEQRDETIVEILQKVTAYNLQNLFEFRSELTTIEGFSSIQDKFPKVSNIIQQEVNVSVKGGSIILHHLQTGVIVGTLSFQNLKHRNAFTLTSTYVSGSIPQVTFTDEVEILRSGLVTYNYAFYSPQDFETNECLLSFSRLTIANPKLNYSFQQMNRLINYILVQIVQLIIQPANLTMNQILEQPVQLCGVIDTMVLSILQPQLMYMEYIITDAHIDVKENLNHNDRLSLEAKSVKYSNSYVLDQCRIDIQLPLWVENIDIELSAQVSINDTIISDEFPFMLKWQKLKHNLEIQNLFNARLKNAMEFRSSIKAIKAKLTTEQYQILNRIIAYNFNLDDGKDNQYIYDHQFVFPQPEIRFMIHIEQGDITLNSIPLLVQRLQVESFVSGKEVALNIFADSIQSDRLLQMKQVINHDEVDFIVPFEQLTRTNFRIAQRMKFRHQFQLDFVNNENQELILEIHNANAFLDLLRLQQLITAAVLPDTVFPPSNVKKSMAAIINMKNIELRIPGSNIRISGNINYIFTKFDLCSHKITLQAVEVLNGNRQLMSPVHAFVSVHDQEKSRTCIKNIDSTIESLQFKLSYEDLMDFQSIDTNLQENKQDDNNEDPVAIIANIQLNMVDLQVVTLQQCPVPLFELTLRDSQINVTQMKQSIFNISTQMQLLYFNINQGWEPVVESFVLLFDYAHNEAGNPKSFFSVQINPESDLPLNTNITVESVKAIKELFSVLEKKQKIASVDEQWVSPYLLKNQTGYTLEATVLDRIKKSSHTILIQDGEEKSIRDGNSLAVKLVDDNTDFKEICNINFKRTHTKRIIVDAKIGMLQKQVPLLLQTEIKDSLKIITLSSDIQIQNCSNKDLEIKLIHKLAQTTRTIMLKSREQKYIPVGFEQAMIQMKLQTWSSILELHKVCAKNSSFDLFPEGAQCVILTSIRSEGIQPHQVILQSSYALLNNLPVPVFVHLQFGQPIKVDPRKDLLIDSPLNTLFKFNFKLPAFQVSPPINPQGQPVQVTLRDYLGLEFKVNIVPIGKKLGLYTYAIEGGITLQNSLGLPVFTYGRMVSSKKEKTVLARGTLHQDMQYIAGQPIYQITEEEDVHRNKGNVQAIQEFDELQFSFEQGKMGQREGKFSPQFSLKNPEGRYLISIPLEDGFMECIAIIQIIELRKLITLSPKCVILNNLPRMAMIQQYKCSKSFNLVKDARFPFYWFNAESPKYFRIQSGGLQSGCISLEAQGSTTVPLRDQKGVLTEYITVSCKEEDHTQFIIIEQLPSRRPLYKIVNQMDFDIQMYQSEIQELNVNVKNSLRIGESIDYAFDNPAFKKMLTLELYRDGNFLDITKINLVNAEVSIKQSLVDETIFYVNSRFDMEQRQIVVTLSMQEVHHFKYNYDNLASQFSMLIPRVNISLIGNQPRNELLLLSMRHFEVCVLNDVIQTAQLKIMDIQIDYDAQLRCTYPVLLTQKVANPQIPAISFIAKRAHQIHFINYFQQVQLAIQPIVIRVTEGTIQELHSFFTNFALFQDPPVITLHAWKQVKNVSEKLCFFESIAIYPVKIVLSYQQIEMKKNSYLKSFAGQAINCDEAPLTLAGFAITNCFITQEALSQKVIQNYKDGITMHLLKLLGSIEILGNPLGLVRSFGEGFQDLFEMPYDGFVKGPLEGGLGIAKGVGSLSKNIVSGTFNTVQKITGSVASGISQLSMDDEYLRERQLQNAKKAKTVVHGLGQGMVSLFQGIGLGVTGLVTQPFQGAEKDGVEGFFIGMSKGIAGLVVKPVVGAIDLASKTAEGFKNTANYFDDKPNEIRTRPPRVFYGKDAIFKAYVLQDAEISYILQKNYQIAILDTFCVQYGKYKFAYVFTTTQLLLLEVIKKEVILQIDNDNIKGVELQDDLCLYFYKSIKPRDRIVKAQIRLKNQVLYIHDVKPVLQYLNQKITAVQYQVHDDD